MICAEFTNDCYITWTSLGIAFMTSIGLFISYWINRKQLQTQTEQLISSNFIFILEHIDKGLTKTARNVLYNSHKSLQRLVEDYNSKRTSQELEDLNEIAKYTAGIYEKIGLILNRNEELRQMLLDSHGFTIGRLWIILQPLHETWKKEDHIGDFVEFKKLGVTSYKNHKFKTMIDTFIQENYMKDRFPPDAYTLRHLTQRIMESNQ